MLKPARRGYFLADWIKPAAAAAMLTGPFLTARGYMSRPRPTRSLLAAPRPRPWPSSRLRAAHFLTPRPRPVFLPRPRPRPTFTPRGWGLVPRPFRPALRWQSVGGTLSTRQPATQVLRRPRPRRAKRT